jgi:hypothetical protein
MYWLCHRCYNSLGPSPTIKATTHKIDGGTSSVSKHMRIAHKIDKDGLITPKRTIDQAFSSEPSYMQALEHYYKPFNPSTFRSLLLDWIVGDDAAFRSLEQLK